MTAEEVCRIQFKCEAEDYENVLRRIGHATQDYKTFNCGGSSSYTIKMKGQLTANALGMLQSQDERGLYKRSNDSTEALRKFLSQVVKS